MCMLVVLDVPIVSTRCYLTFALMTPLSFVVTVTLPTSTRLIKCLKSFFFVNLFDDYQMTTPNTVYLDVDVKSTLPVTQEPFEVPTSLLGFLEQVFRFWDYKYDSRCSMNFDHKLAITAASSEDRAQV